MPDMERAAAGPSHIIVPSTPVKLAGGMDDKGSAWSAQRPNAPRERLAAYARSADTGQ